MHPDNGLRYRRRSNVIATRRTVDTSLHDQVDFWVHLEVELALHLGDVIFELAEVT